MNSVLEYKGYHTIVKFSAEDGLLRGKIEGITDYVDFETDDLKKAESEFKKAVDDYLTFCKEVGKVPEKEYKGSFSVRISPQLHKKLVLISAKEGNSLNATVENALESYTTKYISK